MWREVGYDVKCSKGNTIKLHDVCRSCSTGEIVIIQEGVNEHHELKGLVAVEVPGTSGDWLSVYPDRELEVLYNLANHTIEIKAEGSE